MEAKIRMAKAAGAFRNLDKMWRNKNISLKTKLRLYNSNVLSVLTYGAETWKKLRRLKERWTPLKTIA